MEIKSNTKLNIILIVVAIALFIIPALAFIIGNHYRNLDLVIEKYVVEKANDCFNEGNCTNNVITLQELIDKKYIDKLYNPKTKELINLNSYIDIETNEFKIVNE